MGNSFALDLKLRTTPPNIYKSFNILSRLQTALSSKLYCALCSSQSIISTILSPYVAHNTMPTTPSLTPPTLTSPPPPPPPRPHHNLRFWGTFVCLCMLAFISALDVPIITTALPTIIKDIGGDRDYVWIANSFLVASSVPQPLFGQLADVFGRRIPLIFSVSLFALGSGIGGGANSPGMLMVGRTIQGVGAGGIYVLLDIVCCDLVPLRERGKYLGLTFSWSGVAAALGPPVGGALAEADWRWVFWINLPVV